MSNLKKDIAKLKICHFCAGIGYCEHKKQVVHDIFNLIESVIPEEIDVKSKYETDDDGGINVVVDENNDTMTGENLVHLARLASDEGYNQAIKDIKNKLIGKE